jgi:hypothetical protein
MIVFSRHLAFGTPRCYAIGEKEKSHQHFYLSKRQILPSFANGWADINAII